MKNETAFPANIPQFPDTPQGLTKLEWYAGMALSGLSSNPNFTNAAYDTIAGMAFGQAKAMLAEIKKHK